MTEEKEYTIRCIVCDALYVTTDGLTMCIICETKLLPVLIRHDVSVRINWQALRCIVMWAEKFAAQYYEKDPYMLRLVRHHADKMADEHPELSKKLPLTLERELGAIREAFPESDIVTNIIDEAFDLPKGEEE